MAAACDINVVQNGEKVLQIVLTAWHSTMGGW